MKSGRRLPCPGKDVIIWLSDDEDGGGRAAADDDLSTASSTSVRAERSPPIPSNNDVVATPSRTSSGKEEAPALPLPNLARASAAAVAPAKNNSTNNSRGVGDPGGSTSHAATSSAANIPICVTNRVGTEFVSTNENGTTMTANEKRRAQAKKRNSFVQTLLTTPGCVLVIDNLEVDVQPMDVLGQLMRFNNNKERINSVHIPPPYPELNHAVAYVVFMNKESADLAAAFLTRNFVVSTRGRPWIVSRCGQKLNEDDIDFPTLSAFKGELQDSNGDFVGGLKIVTERQDAEYNAAEKRRRVFEQHRKQARVMFRRHAHEEKDLEDNPDLNLYRL